MAVSIILLILIALGGLALTYLLSDDETFLWRLAAGCIIGTAIFGTFGFAAGSVAGFSAATTAFALLLTLAPLLLLIDKGRLAVFRHDLARAKGKMQGADRRKALRFFFYASIAVMLFFFFDRAMIVNDQGIFTGGSNNLGDLPFHLGAIFSFTEAGNLPPQNPNFAGTKFSYPFIADLATAMFMKLGAGVREAMMAQNIAWAFSLLVILESYVRRQVRDRVAGRIAPVLLFFTGGLGFLWFFSDYAAQGRGFFEFIWNLPKDYTIGEGFRWGNSLITLFLTQRSLLVGLPLTLAVLCVMWDRYSGAASNGVSRPRSEIRFLLLGAIAGLLPLIHVHSLLVLFAFGVFLLVADPAKWREWFAFAAGVAILAVPELLWSTAGSATRVSEFIGWHFGWDNKETNMIWFWLKNTGIAIPLIVAGLYLAYRGTRNEAPPDTAKTSKHKPKAKQKPADRPADAAQYRKLLLFYIPFAVLFIVSNTLKLAPWEWDNIKVLVYWFVGSLPFITLAIARLWEMGGGARAAAGLLIVVMSLSGGLDVWRTVSRQINYRIFEPDAVTLANRIRASVPVSALVLNAPTYNSPVVLSGRPSFIRYSGHLGSHGIDYRPREEDTKLIYRGGPAADSLIAKHGIEYVLVSPEERNALQANDAYFSKFPVAAEAGQYKLYRVK